MSRATVLVAAGRMTSRSNAGEGSGVARAVDVLRVAHEDLARFEERDVLSPAEDAVRRRVDSALDRAANVAIDRAVVAGHLRALALTGRWAMRLPAPEDFFVSLPTTDLIMEPTVGNCSACSGAATREVEARVGRAEADRRAADAEAVRRERKLEAGDLSPNPPPSALMVNVDVDREDEGP